MAQICKHGCGLAYGGTGSLGTQRAGPARPCSRTLVELLAVVEDLIDLNELTQMAGNPGADVERALERLVSTGMIVKQGSSQYA
jgi:hypothetical protein